MCYEDRMIPPREVPRVLLLVGVLAASSCVRSEPRAAEPASGPAPAGTTTAAPAPWAPIDQRFTGCAGG
jgi:hypothetical protein